MSEYLQTRVTHVASGAKGMLSLRQERRIDKRRGRRIDEREWQGGCSGSTNAYLLVQQIRMVIWRYQYRRLENNPRHALCAGRSREGTVVGEVVGIVAPCAQHILCHERCVKPYRRLHILADSWKHV
jgi:hypothetical protein